MNAGQYPIVLILTTVRLSSAASSGRESPVSVIQTESVFSIDVIDFEEVADNDSTLDGFVESSGCVDPLSYRVNSLGDT